MRQKTYDRLVEYIIENQNKFYRLAYSYVRNEADALDVVQSAVCKALEKSGTLRNEHAMRTWFYTILVNESLSVLKEKKRVVLSKEETGPEPGYEEKGFELYDELYDQIDQLEPEVQSIIRLRFFEELPLEQIAEIMKMNLSTVKSKLYRGLNRLKIAVREEDYQ